MKTYCEETHCQMWKGTLKELDRRQAEHDKQIREEIVDLIDRHLWNYSHEVWEDFQPILKQLKEQNK